MDWAPFSQQKHPCYKRTQQRKENTRNTHRFVTPRSLHHRRSSRLFYADSSQLKPRHLRRIPSVALAGHLCCIENTKLAQRQPYCILLTPITDIVESHKRDLSDLSDKVSKDLNTRIPNKLSTHGLKGRSQERYGQGKCPKMAPNPPQTRFDVFL
jgi:hypothetical protein